MARFNKTVATKSVTTNLAGGKAYSVSDKFELVSILLTSFLTDDFYRPASGTVDRVAELITKAGPLFAAKAAVYARNVFGMRSVSHLVAAIVGHVAKGESWTRGFFRNVVYRVDDVTEILSLYKMLNHGKMHPLPNAMKRGLGDALSKFNEYELGKYRAEGNDVSLVDAVNLLHPKHTDALGKLMRGELRSQTYQTELTRVGQSDMSDEEKLQARIGKWTAFLADPKVPYFAALRNIRNIMQDAPILEGSLCAVLTDREKIRKSKVFPFRYLTALENLGLVPLRVRAAIAQAMEISLDNVPVFDGSTVVLVDDSGSMMGKPINTAAPFAAALAKKNCADIIRFSDGASYVAYNPMDSMTSIADGIKKNARMAGTNLAAGINKMNKKYDRIFILSDMQSWYDGAYSNCSVKDAFASYKKTYDADPMVYSIDLCGYGTAQFAGDKVVLLAGFSDKLFDIVPALETGRDSLVKMIEAISVSD